MITRILNVFIVIFIFSSTSVAQDTGRVDTSFETLVWKGIPLKLHLKEGTESILRFSQRVQVGLPPDMVGMFEVESVASTVYITPLSDFAETRIRFKLLDTNSVLLFDVKANRAGQTLLMDIVLAEDIENSIPMRNDGSQSIVSDEPISYDYVDLVRYALQNIYSPERLIKPLSEITEVKINDMSAVQNVVAGFDVTAIPAAQWKTNDGLYITAVYLQNLGVDVIRLDPRRMRNSKDWLATSLYKNVLEPRTIVGDTTTMVVVSNRKWEESVSWLR